MELLILEAVMSAIYVFDLSAFPFIHVPFYILTLLYFASILELVGAYKLARSVSRRLGGLHHRSATRLFSIAL